jgi:hypothetical protein
MEVAVVEKDITLQELLEVVEAVLAQLSVDPMVLLELQILVEVPAVV